jgi:N-acetylglucosaminyldiphosphoundecaprenol N-acetyl-beta-D-mannosaminyltransferase
MDTYTLPQTISEIERCIKERDFCQHVVVNATKIVEMQTDPFLKQIIHSCKIINVDGMPVVWASKLLGKPVAERITGVDLFQELVELCSIKGYKPFFFGARQEVVESVVQVFKNKYPNLDVAGYRNGYYSSREEMEIARQIRDSGADMLFVAISTPTKEIFINNWLNEMRVPFCMGVGGSFDVVAGRTTRAPRWMQNAGLEWAYRIYQEPRRMWKRYVKTNPLFIWMLLKELVRVKREKPA